MHHTYDPNLINDDQHDIVNQLKAKHEMLKQTRQRRVRSPHDSRQNSLRRRKMSHMSGDYESSTDIDSRPASVMTEHAGNINLAFINEKDEETKLGNDVGTIRKGSQNIQLEEMNAKNAADQAKNKRQRKKTSTEQPNGLVAHESSTDTDNNLNQNNSATNNMFYYGNGGLNSNGFIPNQPNNTNTNASNGRPDHSISYQEPTQISIISGHRLPDSRQTPYQQHIVPIMRVNTNGHVIKQDSDPDFEEDFTYL